jgi:hypothetical protein
LGTEGNEATQFSSGPCRQCRFPDTFPDSHSTFLGVLQAFAVPLLELDDAHVTDLSKYLNRKIICSVLAISSQMLQRKGKSDTSIEPSIANKT